jgi:hypothetical protein
MHFFAIHIPVAGVAQAAVAEAPGEGVEVNTTRTGMGEVVEGKDRRTFHQVRMPLVVHFLLFSIFSTAWMESSMVVIVALKQHKGGFTTISYFA